MGRAELVERLAMLARADLGDLAPYFTVVDGRRVLDLEKLRKSGKSYGITKLTATRSGDIVDMPDRLGALTRIAQLLGLFTDAVPENPLGKEPADMTLEEIQAEL